MLYLLKDSEKVEIFLTWWNETLYTIILKKKDDDFFDFLLIISVRNMFFKCYFIYKWNTWKTINETKHDDMSDCKMSSLINEK